MRFTPLDRYLLANVAGSLGSVFGIVIGLLLFEHLPRLFDVARLSGRKAIIIFQSMIALLPEYAGIGLLFGLYLAIALTVRRLSLRGELDAIEAAGIPPHRWMQGPVFVTAVVATLLLWTQGWLMPAGERRLHELGRQMQDGNFGFDLESGSFIDLGNNVALKFDRIDSSSGTLGGVFVRKGDTSFMARRGRLGFDFAAHVLVDLDEGLSLNGKTGQVLSFSHFRFDNGALAGASRTSEPTETRKGKPLTTLLESDDAADNAAAWSRILWPVFAMLTPLLALVLGKSPRRSGSSFGLVVGLVMLILFIRTTGLVAMAKFDHPAMLAVTVALGWAIVAGLLVSGERRWGPGYVDTGLRELAKLVAR